MADTAVPPGPNGLAPEKEPVFMTIVEVFADVVCPFTHVGLRRFVAHRHAVGRPDVELVVRAWPLEIVNGVPMDPHVIADEVDDLRQQVSPDLFRSFTESAVPTSSLPALALCAAAYGDGIRAGERVSLAVRDLLFERGADIGDPEVLAGVQATFGIRSQPDEGSVLADHAEGVARGVVGSPHFFTPAGDFFCPTLEIHRDAAGHLQITEDLTAFDTFMSACFG